MFHLCCRFKYRLEILYILCRLDFLNLGFCGVFNLVEFFDLLVKCVKHRLHFFLALFKEVYFFLYEFVLIFKLINYVVTHTGVPSNLSFETCNLSNQISFVQINLTMCDHRLLYWQFTFDKELFWLKNFQILRISLKHLPVNIWIKCVWWSKLCVETVCYRLNNFIITWLLKN